MTNDNDNDCTKSFFPSRAEPAFPSRAEPAFPSRAEPDDTDNDAVQAWPPYAELMLDDEPF